MDKATKQEFEKLATMVAEGFTFAHESNERRFDNLDEEIRSIRTELVSVRAEIDRIPDTTDRMYGKTLTDVLGRKVRLEKRVVSIEEAHKT